MSVPSLQKRVCWYTLLRYTHDVSFLSSSRVHFATVVLHTLRVSPVFSMRVIGWLTWFESCFCYRFLFFLPSGLGESSVACFAGLVSAVRSAVSKWRAFLPRLNGTLNAPAHEDFRGGWMQLQAQVEEVRTPALHHIEAELSDVVPRDHCASSIEIEDSRARRASPDWISAFTRALAARLQHVCPSSPSGGHRRCAPDGDRRKQSHGGPFPSA